MCFQIRCTVAFRGIDLLQSFSLCFFWWMAAIIELVSLLYVYSGSYWVVYLVTVSVYTAVKHGTSFADTETLPWLRVSRPDLFLHFTSRLCLFDQLLFEKDSSSPTSSISTSLSFVLLTVKLPKERKEIPSNIVEVRNSPLQIAEINRYVYTRKNLHCDLHPGWSEIPHPPFTWTLKKNWCVCTWNQAFNQIVVAVVEEVTVLYSAVSKSYVLGSFTIYAPHILLSSPLVLNPLM